MVMSGYEDETVSDPSPLAMRVAVESLSAMFSSLTVAPAISIVDQAIVSNASGRQKLVPCLISGMKNLVFRPVYFFSQPSFLFIWGVYSGTYIVANNIEAICERQRKSSFMYNFVG
jgi:hypothetical protein